uniref:Uncharacterized protein n=1 Tax=Nitrosopumivirus cobalaminus TaxID=3158414 RepID=A0AAU7N449_9VIRU
MVVSYVNAATPIRDVDKLVKSLITIPTVRVSAGTDLPKGYSWYSPALGSSQIHINEDTGFADQTFRVLGDNSKRELIQVYIDVFCPANKMRSIMRSVDSIIWEAGKNRPVIEQLYEFDETEVYWVIEQKRDIKDAIAHASGTLVCVQYKDRT